MHQQAETVAVCLISTQSWTVTIPHYHQEEFTYHLTRPEAVAIRSEHEWVKGVAILMHEKVGFGLPGLLLQNGKSGSGKLLYYEENWSPEMNWMGGP